jgi:hypothetical protein
VKDCPVPQDICADKNVFAKKTCLPLSEEFWRVKDQKKYYWHQKKYPKGSRKTGINKKIPLETYTLINH